MFSLYGASIFLSSFLLFLIQPIFAKLILPWFGGSAAVWTTCMVFFQVALLAGYAYAHAMRRFPVVHIALLAATMFFLPVIPGVRADGANPTWRILLLLTTVLGLPYFLLSSTGPLLQSWYPGAWPYRLFALSNAGALIALAAYPVLIEPALPTRTQDLLWSGAFAGFAILCGITAWIGRDALAKVERRSERPATSEIILWVALAAVGSMLLLSTTNQITQNVAAVPFLWILPLAIYLITFILCFESSRWYRRSWFVRPLAIALIAVGYLIYDIQLSDAIAVALPVLLGGLFVCCMFCHGELSARKPEASHLTLFYLMVALGGALGAVFVGVVAPVMFSGIYELPVALLAVAAMALALTWKSGWSHRLIWSVVAAAMAMVLGAAVRSYRLNAVVLVRSFYGALRVVRTTQDGNEVRTLYHGTVKHGSEIMAPGVRLWPTTYYGPDSGIGLALRYATEKPKRAGVIGLGTGTLAAYGRAGDEFRFYEINPQVIELAHSQFAFLSESAGHVEVVPGDARLSLEREPSQNFDVLAVDAFSGDAIPVHLLTREAFALYFRHLDANGVLAIHVSNQYLRLAPVAMQLAAHYGYPAALVHSERDERQLLASATWVLITRNRNLAKFGQPIAPEPGLRMWTDDYNNLLQVIRWVPTR